MLAEEAGPAIQSLLLKRRACLCIRAKVCHGTQGVPLCREASSEGPAATGCGRWVGLPQKRAIHENMHTVEHTCVIANNKVLLVSRWRVLDEHHCGSRNVCFTENVDLCVGAQTYHLQKKTPNPDGTPTHVSIHVYIYVCI